MPSKPISIISGSDIRGRNIRYREGHLIVKFKKDVDLSNGSHPLLDTIIGAGQYEPVRPGQGAWHYLETHLSDDILKKKIADLAARDGVIAYAEHDFALKPCAMPDDPMLEENHDKEQWGPRFMNMSQTWDFQQGTEDVAIAVFDTGIPIPATVPIPQPGRTDNLLPYPFHEDLDGKRFYPGLDDVNGVRWPHDDYQTAHGTQMAGIIAAKQNNPDPANPARALGLAGINWASSVFALKALHLTYPSGSYQSTIGLYKLGLVDAVAFVKSFDPAKKLILNLSMQDDSEYFGINTLNDFYIMVEENDAIVCIAAAEANGLAKTAEYGANHVDYKGHVIVVGACQKDDNTPFQHDFDDMVYAPGQDIWSTAQNHSFDKISGTSPATAHVSGLASILWSEAPHLGAKDVVKVLKEACRDPKEAAKPSYGVIKPHGIVDAFAAFQGLKARLCLVLDRSGSMGSPSGISDLSRMEILKTTAQDLVGLIDAGSTLGLTSFDHSASLDTPPGLVFDVNPPTDPPSQRAMLTNAIDALAPEGFTSIGAGVQKAAEAILPDEFPPPKALIVLTDGMENSPPFLADLEPWDEHISVYAIGMGSPEVLHAESLTDFVDDHLGYMITADVFENEGTNTLSKFLSQIMMEISDYALLEDPDLRLKADETYNLRFPLGQWDRDAEILLLQPPGAPIEVRVFSPESTVPWAGTRALNHGKGRVVRHQIIRTPVPTRPRWGDWRVEIRLPEKDFRSWTARHKDGQVAEWSRKGVPLTLMIATRSSLRMRCRVRQSGYRPGATMNLSVQFTEDRLPHDARHRLFVEVTDPNNKQSYPDPKAEGPGAYSCSITASEQGIYRWFIRAEGQSGSKKDFRRECVLTGAVWKRRLQLGPRPLRIGPRPGIPHA